MKNTFDEQSAAFRAEKPWCGWMLAFSEGSDCDTVSTFGMTAALNGIHVLLTTADGVSRSVCILDTNVDVPQAPTETFTHRGIEVTAVDDHGKTIMPERREIVRYEDIREVVVF